MDHKLYQLNMEKIVQTRSYTSVVLSSSGRELTIYTEPHVGKFLQQALTGATPPRPLTHDLIGSLFLGLEIQVRQVVIIDLEDTTYLARLIIEQKINDQPHFVEVDARPSDCLVLAILHQAPILATKQVLDKTESILNP